MKLEDKVILVTGASDGIGKAISLRLAKEETNLALLARNEKRLKSVQERCKKGGAHKAELYLCDICNTKSLSDTVKKITTDFGKIDVLINNAGIWQKTKQVDELDESVVDKVIQTNLSGQIHLTRMVLPFLKEQKQSVIINVISKSGFAAQEGQSVYSASKWGMRGFTEVLKADLKGTGVRVAGVYQSGTNTDMFKKTGEEVPNEKFTKPEDLADVIYYMLSRPEKIWLHEVRVTY